MPDKPLFDLTDEKISDTFQYMLQVRDTDSTLYDGVNTVMEFHGLSYEIQMLFATK